jgi:oligopeptide/dipeptide ABC transporter ATP-binding protein
MTGEPSMVEAVAGVSFSIATRETFAIVGESGSGKTTLARAIAGLVPPSEGSIRFDGRQIAGSNAAALRPLRQQFSMVFQDPVGSLSPRLTVGAIIAEPFRVHGLAGPDLPERVSSLLEMVGLPSEFSRRYPHQLSGGQARRVNIARALALEPRLIIADEPTAGLDVSVQGGILNLINELQDRLGVSILIITHNLQVVRHVADRMAVMYLGRIVETGPSAAIFARPRHPYTAALLSASPEPDPDARLSRMEIRGEIPSLLHRPPGCEFHTRCPFAETDCRMIPPKATVDQSMRTFTCHHPLGDRLGSGRW